MNQLTTIAALPSGAGCMASLPAERVEAKEPEYALCTKWITLEEARDLYQPKKNIWSAIDWTNFDLSGGFGC
jgi:hypothetical protein